MGQILSAVKDKSIQSVTKKLYYQKIVCLLLLLFCYPENFFRIKSMLFFIYISMDKV